MGWTGTSRTWPVSGIRSVRGGRSSEPAGRLLAGSRGGVPAGPAPREWRDGPPARRPRPRPGSPAERRASSSRANPPPRAQRPSAPGSRQLRQQQPAALRGQYPSRSGSHPNALRMISGSSQREARRSWSSRPLAPGCLRRMSTSASSWTASVRLETRSSRSRGVIRRYPSVSTRSAAADVSDRPRNSDNRHFLVLSETLTLVGFASAGQQEHRIRAVLRALSDPTRRGMVEQLARGLRPFCRATARWRLVRETTRRLGRSGVRPSDEADGRPPARPEAGVTPEAHPRSGEAYHRPSPAPVWPAALPAEVGRGRGSPGSGFLFLDVAATTGGNVVNDRMECMTVSVDLLPGDA